MRQLSGLLLALATLCAGADYKAGAGRINITPTWPMYLSGYGSRTHASDGKITDLWAKAVAIEDRNGSRVVIVGTDLSGLTRAITDVVAARVMKEYGLDRARLVFNSSHTHTAPIIRKNLIDMFALDDEQRRRTADYGRELTGKLVTVVGAALGDLAPANLSFGAGSVGFAVNRRLPTPQGYINSPNPSGPTDHDVPVLKITAPDGKLRAILFGYACHNTTLTAGFYQFSGDYAGFAQLDLERENPGVIALFLMLCGGDQNPYPRGKLEYAEKHGADLAAEVSRVAAGSMKPVHGTILAAFQTVDLPFAIYTRETFEARLNDSDQAVAFGKDLVLIALGGEPVVDYALRIKKEYGAKGIIVAGYSNDVMSYIPSLRVLKEGGYEAAGAMISYGLPGPYTEDVEDRVFTTIHQVMKRVKR